MSYKAAAPAQTIGQGKTPCIAAHLAAAAALGWRQLPAAASRQVTSSSRTVKGPPARPLSRQPILHLTLLLLRLLAAALVTRTAPAAAAAPGTSRRPNAAAAMAVLLAAACCAAAVVAVITVISWRLAILALVICTRLAPGSTRVIPAALVAAAVVRDAPCPTAAAPAALHLLPAAAVPVLLPVALISLLLLLLRRAVLRGHWRCLLLPLLAGSVVLPHSAAAAAVLRLGGAALVGSPAVAVGGCCTRRIRHGGCSIHLQVIGDGQAGRIKTSKQQHSSMRAVTQMAA